jgi:hypothetical protein
VSTIACTVPVCSNANYHISMSSFFSILLGTFAGEVSIGRFGLYGAH